ncbi:FadR/GntR family transcriptional regulator [Bailinhaonella thermotolerans]|uniref:FadR family transcriptional regulator n=1 Tax=Bailinhaonella thermotolerans TaxID=1070861 RepID=A0A3A4AAI2_9ACTN|nr:FCD domain-containing protein [Bailinhaonella thermotolerans]RJL25089.1 FadR family transcriptional regulator [Bailinhaonella thermotolerans]
MDQKAAKISVTQRAIEQIKAMIAEGELRAGQRLPTERDLSADLGLSRSSMREAIRALTAMGVLEARHGAGVYVTQLAPSDLLETFGVVAEISRGATLVELLQIRRILEPAATSMAAARVTDAQLAVIHTHLEEMAASEQIEEFVAADLAFHRDVVAAAGNATLAAIIDGLSTRTFRARVWRGQKEKGVLSQMHLEHVRIYRALAARDPEAASAAAAVHVGEVENWLRENIADFE